MVKEEFNSLESFKIYASLDMTASDGPAVAAALSLPKLEDRQKDLQYLKALLVSSGFNLNSTYFLPSEMMMAADSVVNKPLDIEHEMDKVVGHIYAAAYVGADGSVFDPYSALKEAGMEVDNTSIDIVIASHLYKARFPEVAEDVESGKYKVSMECFYKDYDVIVDGVIIPRQDAESLGLIKVVNNIVRVVEGNADRGSHRVGKVIRGLIFSGCGLVEVPANPKSEILETAAVHNRDYILDLTKVDSYMTAKKEDESLVINKLGGPSTELSYLGATYGGIHAHEIDAAGERTFNDGCHRHIIMPTLLPDGYSVYFTDDGAHRHDFSSDGGKIGSNTEHTHKVYVEYVDGDNNSRYSAYESGAAKPAHFHELESVDTYETWDRYYERVSELKRGNTARTTFSGGHYHEIEIGDGIKLKTLTPQEVLKLEEANKDMSIDEKNNKEDIENAGVIDGTPGSRPDICISFKRYVYDIAGDSPGVPDNSVTHPSMHKKIETVHAPSIIGAGDQQSPDDRIIQENWCVLFELGCPVPGGMASHPNCWRQILGSFTKEQVSTYYEKILENRNNRSFDEALVSLKESIQKSKE